jgi:hypothetical protein
MANTIEFLVLGKDKASGALKRVGKAMRSMAKTARNVGVAAVAASAALGTFVNKVTQTQDRVAKMGARLGIATDDLSKFQFIAQRGGVSVENMGLAMQRMTRRVSEAAKGMGEAQGALEELNIEAKTLNAAPLPKQMTIIASKLKDVKNQADRVRIAFKLFDSEGVGAVLQTIDDLGPNFEAISRDFEYLGGTITPQAAKNAEEFQNQMVRVKTSLFGIGQTISNKLAPTFTLMAEKFANFVADNRERVAKFVQASVEKFIHLGFQFKAVIKGMQDVFSQGFSKGMIKIMGSAMSMLWGMLRKSMEGIGLLLISAFVAAFDAIKSGIFKLGQNFIDLFKAGFKSDHGIFNEVGDALAEGFKKSLNEKAAPVFDEFIKDVGAGIKNKVKLEAITLGIDTAGAKEDAQKLINSIEEVTAAKEKEKETDEKITEAVKLGTWERIGLNRIAINSIGESAQEVLATVGQSVMDQNEMFLEGQELLNEHLKVFREQQFEAGLAFSTQFKELMLEQIDAVSDAVASSIVDASNLGQALEGVLKSVLKSVVSMLIKLGLQKLKDHILTLTLLKTTASAEASKGVALTGVNTFASVSAAPWPISLTAPFVAAKHMAGALSMFGSGAAAGAAIGKTIGSIAHGGLDFVPREETYLLNRGERVLAPKQNTDLTNFLSGSGRGASNTRDVPVNIDNITIEILPNATNLDALREITVDEFRDEMGYKIIEALNDLDRAGVRPNFVESLRGSK